MIEYYCVYVKDRKPVCGAWVNGTDEDDARLTAEYRAMARYPDMEYDVVEVTSSRIAK